MLKPVETLRDLEWSFLATVGPLLLGAALIAGVMWKD